MKKLIIITIFICSIKVAKAQTPDCLKGTYFVSTLLDTFDLVRTEITDFKVIVLKGRSTNLIKDISLNCMSLLKRIGPGYAPIKQDQRDYFIYPNGQTVTHDSNFIYFLTPNKI